MNNEDRNYSSGNLDLRHIEFICVSLLELLCSRVETSRWGKISEGQAHVEGTSVIALVEKIKANTTDATQKSLLKYTLDADDVDIFGIAPSIGRGEQDDAHAYHLISRR